MEQKGLAGQSCLICTESSDSDISGEEWWIYTNLLLESVGSSLWKMFFPNYSTKSIGEHNYKEFFVDPLMSGWW